MIKTPSFWRHNKSDSELASLLRLKIEMLPLMFWAGLLLTIGSFPILFFSNEVFLGVILVLIGVSLSNQVLTIDFFRDYLQRKGHLDEIMNSPSLYARNMRLTTLWVFVGTLIIGILFYYYYVSE